MDKHQDVLFRSCGTAEYCEDNEALRFSGTVDFLTYFNSCSVGKWRKYTHVSRIFLCLVLSGDDCLLQFSAARRNMCTPARIGTEVSLSSIDACDSVIKRNESTHCVTLELPQGPDEVIGFFLRTEGVAYIHEAYYFAEVDSDLIRPIKLALSTTTFKKEAYIQPNIELVKNEILSSDDPIAGNFHMFVVDNGRTLDASVLSDSGVTVIPNKNVGGSGGFARGMMEAIASNQEFTHVLLMDDDVKISTESLSRTYNLLSLAKAEYRDAFINGAMLSIEKPNMQFEDVSYVIKSGAYRKIKENLFINNVEDVAENEAIDVEVPHAYGAWWFSCIPVSAIKKNGLPLPLFVRCDDVEYGMRSTPKFMTMNGICVWHEAFEGRFRASVDCYQYVRNFLVMIAMDDCASESMFLARMRRNIRLQLRVMDYNTADLFLDGFEDYLKGPEYLAKADGEMLMKKNGLKNTKLVPIDQLEIDVSELNVRPQMIGRPRIEPESPDLDKRDHRPHPFRRVWGFVRHNSVRFWRMLPYDRHFLPEGMLKSSPKPIFYSGLTCCGIYTMGAKTLVALDREAENGAVRHYDKERWIEVRKRLKMLMRKHREQGREIRRAYKEAKPWLTSWDFWNSYLGTDLKLKD